MKIAREGELRMEREDWNGMFLGYRVVHTIYFEDGSEAECELGDGLDEDTARTILQRLND
jgi:hypothetical protein